MRGEYPGYENIFKNADASTTVHDMYKQRIEELLKKLIADNKFIRDTVFDDYKEQFYKQLSRGNVKAIRLYKKLTSVATDEEMKSFKKPSMRLIENIRKKNKLLRGLKDELNSIVSKKQPILEKLGLNNPKGTKVMKTIALLSMFGIIGTITAKVIKDYIINIGTEKPEDKAEDKAEDKPEDKVEDKPEDVIDLEKGEYKDPNEPPDEPPNGGGGSGGGDDDEDKGDENIKRDFNNLFKILKFGLGAYASKKAYNTLHNIISLYNESINRKGLNETELKDLSKQWRNFNITLTYEEKKRISKEMNTFEMHLSGHAFVGPGTNVVKKLYAFNDAKFTKSLFPVSSLDLSAAKHDIFYLNKDPSIRKLSDQILLKETLPAVKAGNKEASLLYFVIHAKSQIENMGMSLNVFGLLDLSGEKEYTDTLSQNSVKDVIDVFDDYKKVLDNMGFEYPSDNSGVIRNSEKMKNNKDIFKSIHTFREAFGELISRDEFGGDYENLKVIDDGDYNNRYIGNVDVSNNNDMEWYSTIGDKTNVINNIDTKYIMSTKKHSEVSELIKEISDMDSNSNYESFYKIYNKVVKKGSLKAGRAFLEKLSGKPTDARLLDKKNLIFMLNEALVDKRKKEQVEKEKQIAKEKQLAKDKQHIQVKIKKNEIVSASTSSAKPRGRIGQNEDLSSALQRGVVEEEDDEKNEDEDVDEDIDELEEIDSGDEKKNETSEIYTDFSTNAKQKQKPVIFNIDQQIDADIAPPEIESKNKNSHGDFPYDDDEDDFFNFYPPPPPEEKKSDNTYDTDDDELEELIDKLEKEDKLEKRYRGDKGDKGDTLDKRGKIEILNDTIKDLIKIIAVDSSSTKNNVVDNNSYNIIENELSPFQNYMSASINNGDSKEETYKITPSESQLKEDARRFALYNYVSPSQWRSSTNTFNEDRVLKEKLQYSGWNFDGWGRVQKKKSFVNANRKFEPRTIYANNSNYQSNTFKLNYPQYRAYDGTSPYYNPLFQGFQTYRPNP